MLHQTQLIIWSPFISKPYQEVEFLEVEESSISKADLDQIVAIVAATASPPTSFAAIRNSRK